MNTIAGFIGAVIIAVLLFAILSWGYRAQAQGWRYSCPGVSWSMGVIEVEHKPGEKIHAELGLCPDGVVLWRPAQQIYSPSK